MVDWLPPRLRTCGTDRKLQRGESLFRSGDATIGLYEVRSGRINLLRVDQSGREIVLYSATAGETFAEASLFSTTYHCDAIASTAAVARLYPKATVLRELTGNPAAARSFMAGLAYQVMDLRTRLERRNIRSARERVRHFLLLNAGADRRTVALPGTLKDLAADLGLTHEALYRALARMAAEGEIRRLDGKIQLSRTI
jgi:CRP-like cAMP-binding protein